ncbi:MAG: bifunctional sugar phosphate isomerase/epimerase/4-hydroxyphenylpyruvate dioxygenase family protein [Brevibacterium aurantiacum]|uniref:3-dehydroshikimate dehydratase n=3 Tax=Brevibacterium aurantiacum TaxID=273384 RepID=A0A1D7W7X8_BREAU|nr:sugar phosphate isomerase/epimerase and 4-hydroxyphenylpyruvate domain-containing protein [Brevibacterium aurantiacum]AOP55092.1 4-hydroxyphenylpyruvate dioxygenase [Brevibacterium aurantiacum]AZL10587.1 sugar phosphate isomerase/epimerase and 4-hydroxyphenylpyruvate domain-containing protein [Brevibacterium aurantiacum]AZT94806.1 sugar phosphate isomerase/epimerase and 4-hydroxyphenylpyruvate domain-containing protein [Brevibacterium aurantiacum]PCC47016.1 4-hydroxyphenylpyruvate dioxygenas
MRTSIATVCLSGTLEEKLRAAARAGFDGVEIFEQDLVVSPTSPEAIAKLAADLGISLDLYQPFRDLEGVDEAQFQKNLKRAETKFQLMARLRIDTILLCSNVGTATISDDGVVVEQLRRLGDLADCHRVNIAYEALAWGRFVSEYDHAWDLVKAADHPRIGTCLDSFHILSRNTDLSRIAEIPGEKIFFLQLADAPALTMDVLSWSRHHRVFPGEGAWDLSDFLTRIAATGYAGPVSLEVFNDSFRQGDTNRTAVDGLRSLRWLEASIADTPGKAAESQQSAGSAGPGSALDLQPLPEVEEPRGINYVELSTDDLGTLTRQMHQLGFQFIGYHRSKPHVQLWLRGQARIIVSEVTEEAGTTSAPVNGTFLRGIGFEVTDSQSAMDRAALLHAEEVPRDQAHDDEVLRGVFAPDGSEVFFHQFDAATPAWIKEFGHDHDEQVSHIDHVNLAQPSNHYDEAVLFYTSLLALHAQSSQDVPSPSGLVRSQVMSSTDGSVRMPLNVSPQPNAEAVAGRGIGSVVEAYPEHVAVACEDIFQAAATALSRGLDFLPVPQNYYEDLDSRFDLDLEFLQRLQENHVLYDRDEHGEFLHFYTSTIGSVFFEMIERRGDYLGFGAPDAPVRLAAQHRKNSQRGA